MSVEEYKIGSRSDFRHTGEVSAQVDNVLKDISKQPDPKTVLEGYRDIFGNVQGTLLNILQSIQGESTPLHKDWLTTLKSGTHETKQSKIRLRMPPENDLGVPYSVELNLNSLNRSYGNPELYNLYMDFTNPMVTVPGVNPRPAAAPAQSPLSTIRRIKTVCMPNSFGIVISDRYEGEQEVVYETGAKEYTLTNRYGRSNIQKGSIIVPNNNLMVSTTEIKGTTYISGTLQGGANLFLLPLFPKHVYRDGPDPKPEVDLNDIVTYAPPHLTKPPIKH